MGNSRFSSFIKKMVSGVHILEHTKYKILRRFLVRLFCIFQIVPFTHVSSGKEVSVYIILLREKHFSSLASCDLYHYFIITGLLAFPSLQSSRLCHPHLFFVIRLLLLDPLVRSMRKGRESGSFATPNSLILRPKYLRPFQLNR